ncbi:hypothetical protein HUJ05_001889 [Dendroctonus ponderosae]|nr:hypothetical protein HUJ05_001889 [Dendroctonus ponderosae]
MGTLIGANYNESDWKIMDHNDDEEMPEESFNTHSLLKFHEISDFLYVRFTVLYVQYCKMLRVLIRSAFDPMGSTVFNFLKITLCPKSVAFLRTSSPIRASASIDKCNGSSPRSVSIAAVVVVDLAPVIPRHASL